MVEKRNPRNIVRDKFQDLISQKADIPQSWYGYMGNGAGVVEVSGEANFVWVTLSDGFVTKAYNPILPAVLNLPVVVGYDTRQYNSNLLRVLDVRTVPRFQESEESIKINPHRASHEWMNPDGGQDVIFVHLRQFRPLRPTLLGSYDYNTGIASNPFLVYIDRDVQYINGVWKSIGNETIDLASYVPAAVSGSNLELFTLISISGSSGAAVVTSGSAVPMGTISVSNIPTTPSNHVPIAAIRLYSTQVLIVESKQATDLIDLRLSMFDSVFDYNYAPYIHASSHEAGGYDEIDVTGLHGILADNQKGTYPTIEDLSSQCDGSETVFTPAYNFDPGTLEVFLNGLLQVSGSAGDYLEDATGIDFTYNLAPWSGDRLIVKYTAIAPFTVTGPYAPSYGTRSTLISVNLHGHTTESDGSLSPANYVAMYAALGYGALAITDHDLITNQPAGIDTAIPGNECSPTTGHIGSINSTYTRGSETDLQTIINGIVAGGGIAILNHPNWDTGISQATMAALTGFTGLEIHNAQCVGLGTNQEGFATIQWDYLLNNARKDIWGFSTDDYHSTSYRMYGGIGRIKAFVSSNTLNNVMDSIIKGCFVSDAGNHGVTPGYPVISKSGVSLACPGATALRFLNQDGLAASVSGSSGGYSFETGDQFLRIEAVGDYTEDFQTDMNWTKDWGYSGGAWVSGSGVLNQSTNTTGPFYSFVKRNIEGDISAQADIKLVGTDNETQIGFIFNARTTSDYWYLRLAGSAAKNPNTISLWHAVGGSFVEDPSTIYYSFTPTRDVFYTVKFEFTYSGRGFKAKIWEAGTSEPGTWGIDTTIASSTPNGKIGFRCRYSAAIQNLYINGFKSYYQPIPVGDWE